MKFKNTSGFKLFDDQNHGNDYDNQNKYKVVTFNCDTDKLNMYDIIFFKNYPPKTKGC